MNDYDFILEEIDKTFKSMGYNDRAMGTHNEKHKDHKVYFNPDGILPLISISVNRVALYVAVWQTYDSDSTIRHSLYDSSLTISEFVVKTAKQLSDRYSALTSNPGLCSTFLSF